MPITAPDLPFNNLPFFWLIFIEKNFSSFLAEVFNEIKFPPSFVQKNLCEKIFCDEKG